MHTFLSHYISLQEFIAALAMLGLGLEGYATDLKLSANGQLTSRKTP
jgi:hypothetical protein